MNLFYDAASLTIAIAGVLPFDTDLSPLTRRKFYRSDLFRIIRNPAIGTRKLPLAHGGLHYSFIMDLHHRTAEPHPLLSAV